MHKKANAEQVYLILSGASTSFNAIVFLMLTVYYVQIAGMNPLQLVLIGTISEITEFAFEIPTGIIADVYGRRLSVIIGTFLTGAAFVINGCMFSFFIIACGMVIWRDRGNSLPPTL